MLAKVVVSSSVKLNDGVFTYIIPKDLEESITKGSRVLVNFGNSNVQGFVIDIFEGDFDGLKEITELVDKIPYLNEESLEIANFLKEKTLSPLINCYQVMLPSGIKANKNSTVDIKYIKYITIKCDENTAKNYCNSLKGDAQKRILSDLIENKSIEYKSTYKTSIKKMLDDEIIEIIEKEKYSYKYDEVTINKEINLTDEQNNIYEKVIYNINKSKTYLLHGITGSGKTEVYITLAEDVVNSGKSVLLLVPEIAIAYQIQKRFTPKFKDNIAVYNSSLSKQEKFDEFRRVIQNKASIVIGTRSACFLPFNNLGLIIIDEEHDASYKQDINPKYHATDVCEFRSKYNNIPLILASATPRIESYAKAQKGVYELLTLKNRPNSLKMPNVTIVDLKTEEKLYGLFTNTLLTAIKNTIENGNQVILLLNKKGFSTTVLCENCGHVYKCKHCDIALTYYRSSNKLKCSYCSYTENFNEICSKCSSKIILKGSGTELVEAHLKTIFKDANILRLDADIVSSKKAKSTILSSFYENKANILIGTQMIAKGLDFPNVTLVGVINADTSLYIPDFRSSEKTFDLLSQVAGRSGRTKEGSVIIQTYNKDNYSIVYAKNHDYVGFYKEEMQLRHMMGYSPFYYMAKLTIISSDYEILGENTNKVKRFLLENLKDVIILGPAMHKAFKLNNKYRMQIILKYKKFDNIKQTLNDLQNLFISNNKILIDIDIDFINT